VLLPIDEQYLPLLLRLNEQDINDILFSGLQVMMISSLFSIILTLIVVAWLAQNFARPILRLAGVARDVAAGNLSRRANFAQGDEIGQLGRSFDQATETIADLVAQQARTAGERKAILQSIADGVLAVDPDERIIMINPTAAALLGQEPDELIGQPLTALKALEDPLLGIGVEQMIQQIRSELVDEDRASTEDHVTLGDRTIRLHSNPTLVNGDITGAVVVLQDVTHAVKADRAKSEFIATASHELRTPLASMRGFVDVFTMSGTDNLRNDQRMFFEAIQRQTYNLVQLVNDVLEVARLEQGKQRAERRWVQPASAIDEALVSLHNLIEQRQVTVHTDIPTELPPIWIDPLHLRRLLTNLLSNAIKYVYMQGTVWVRAYEIEHAGQLPSAPLSDVTWPHLAERSLVIAIEDNGVGIQQQDQGRLFTRFFRSENPLSVEVGGTGLGLAVAKSLVEMHEGQIGFWSVEREGSCFWVRLPTPSTEPLVDDADAESAGQPMIAEHI
jgi:PAS domain S-box-containing protein